MNINLLPSGLSPDAIRYVSARLYATIGSGIIPDLAPVLTGARGLNRRSGIPPCPED